MNDNPKRYALNIILKDSGVEDDDGVLRYYDDEELKELENNLRLDLEAGVEVESLALEPLEASDLEPTSSAMNWCGIGERSLLFNTAGRWIGSIYLTRGLWQASVESIEQWLIPGSYVAHTKKIGDYLTSDQAKAAVELYCTARVTKRRDQPVDTAKTLKSAVERTIDSHTEVTMNGDRFFLRCDVVPEGSVDSNWERYREIAELLRGISIQLLDPRIEHNCISGYIGFKVRD